MNKNKIRKAAHKAISKERKGHPTFIPLIDINSSTSL